MGMLLITEESLIDMFRVYVKARASQIVRHFDAFRNGVVGEDTAEIEGPSGHVIFARDRW